MPPNPLSFRLLASIASVVMCLTSLASHGAVSEPALPIPAVAVGRVVSPVVLVEPDRADWTYALGSSVRFTVRVVMDQAPVSGARIDYQLGPERFETMVRDVAVPAEGLVIDGGTMTEPGFLRCRVTLVHGGQTYRSLATAGFAPDQIKPTQTDPADFDAFWQERLAALAKIPARVSRTLVPEACTPEVNVYRLSYDAWNFGNKPMRFYGVLTEPVMPGKFPAVLRVPGAGVRPYFGEVALAAKGVIVLQIGIHGIPINLPQELYDDLRNGALSTYSTSGFDDPMTYYYLRVYLACVRGNDVLVELPNWDGKNLITTGGSQGGQLTIVTSALDSRVTGSVANYPAFCDVTGYLHGRAGGWPHMMNQEANRTEARIRTSSYFDSVNFARRLRAPISFAWGYNDETCPPTSVFSAYNVVTAPKELWLQLQMGHPSTAEFSARFTERILGMIKPVE